MFRLALAEGFGTRKISAVITEIDTQKTLGVTIVSGVRSSITSSPRGEGRDSQDEITMRDIRRRMIWTGFLFLFLFLFISPSRCGSTIERSQWPELYVLSPQLLEQKRPQTKWRAAAWFC